WKLENVSPCASPPEAWPVPRLTVTPALECAYISVFTPPAPYILSAPKPPSTVLSAALQVMMLSPGPPRASSRVQPGAMVAPGKFEGLASSALCLTPGTMPTRLVHWLPEEAARGVGKPLVFSWETPVFPLGSMVWAPIGRCGDGKTCPIVS